MLEESELFRRMCLSWVGGACETDLERALVTGTTAGSIGSLKSSKLGTDFDLLLA